MNMVTSESWGKVGHKRITKYSISDGDMNVSLIDLGATVQRITFRGLDMIISLPSPDLYRKYSNACIGAVVGRYAGRIAGGRFSIDGKKYRLTRNQKGNHLHGGKHGFSTKMWRGEIISSGDSSGVKFILTSPNGEEGYPGNLSVSVTYLLSSDHSLEILYEAASDKDTVINLTNHCYFALNGAGEHEKQSGRQSDSNSGVKMLIQADRTVELNGSIPTGRLLDVNGTEFDFRTERPLSGENGKKQGGYDNTFVFSPHAPTQPVLTAAGIRSGVRLECFTDQPAAQLFTMDGKGEVFAFETQHFPDSPNHPDFPSTLLRAGEIFRSRTVYKFS